MNTFPLFGLPPYNPLRNFLNFATPTPQPTSTAGHTAEPRSVDHTPQMGHLVDPKTSRHGTNRDVSQDMDDVFSSQNTRDLYGP